MSETLKTLTPEDVAKVLHCSVKTVMTYLRSGKIPAKQITRRWYVLEEDLRAFLSSYTKYDKSSTKAQIPELSPVQTGSNRVSALGVCADIPGLSTEKYLQDKREEVELEEEKLSRTTGSVSVIIKAHYDGKTIVPDEPVDLPVNEPLEFELKQSSAELAWDPEKAKAAIRRITSRAKPVGLPLEALRRENIYEDRGV
jgi:excisionase family DNA binding protein